jgi:TolB-like protein
VSTVGVTLRLDSTPEKMANTTRLRALERQAPLLAVRKRAGWLALFLTLGGCAGTVAPPPHPAPAALPDLEAEVASAPQSVLALDRLGIAYREAGRLDQARTTLERALAVDADDPAAVFFLGLTYEDLRRPADARTLYTRYIDVGTDRDLKRLLSGKLAVLERQELVVAAQTAAANEAQLANTPPQPRTIAIFPFLYSGQDPQYQPLSRALAEMLVTDLSQTNRITVLERTRVQLLLDEIRLNQSQLVDSATAVRGGRMLGAERVVQGSVAGNEAALRLQATVVGPAGVISSQPVVEQDALRQLFEMQKRLALGIYSSLGIELTPAERERVTRRQTDNVQALLAYGQCLQAEDAGDYAAAAALCAQAASLDRGFAAAREGADRTRAAAESMQLTTSQLGVLGGVELLQAGALTGLAALDAIQTLVPGEPPRNPTAELTGNEGLGRSTLVEIILRRP